MRHPAAPRFRVLGEAVHEEHCGGTRPGIGVIVPGERWDDRAKPMLDYFLAFEESFNRFPGFNYEVQGVFQERVDGRIKFHTYVVRE